MNHKKTFFMKKFKKSARVYYFSTGPIFDDYLLIFIKSRRNRVCLFQENSKFHTKHLLFSLLHYFLCLLQPSIVFFTTTMSKAVVHTFQCSAWTTSMTISANGFITNEAKMSIQNIIHIDYLNRLFEKTKAHFLGNQAFLTRHRHFRGQPACGYAVRKMKFHRISIGSLPG